MIEKYYRIAGLLIKMKTFGRTADLALPYRVEEVQDEDIVLTDDYMPLKALYPDAVDDACEYVVKGREFSCKLLDYKGFVFHASAIVMDGRAYLFSADSGVGKSTHTGLWREVFGDDRVRVLNDDKPALRLEDGCWYAYGTPWSGKYGINLNLKYPVAGICFLRQAEHNRIELYTANDLVFQLLKQVNGCTSIGTRLKAVSHLDSLVANVPIWYMECNMEREAALLSYQAMSEAKI